ncbi:MAG: VanZ family protein [bacterium]|nr:VanZ family protein [bacterium]
MPILPRNLLLLLIISMILGMLFIGLYPFNYFPKNRVSMKENGLHFFGRGVASSTEVDGWPLESPITLELGLEPARTYKRDIPHILSFCDDTGREVLYLGQWKNFLIVRIMEDSRWIQKIKREIGARDALNPGNPALITLVFNNGSTTIYVNGRSVTVSSGLDLTEAASSRPIRSIVLGNSSIGDSHWQGKVVSFSAFQTALSPDAVLNRYEQRDSKQTSDNGKKFIKYEMEDTESKIIRNKAGNGWDLLTPEILTPLRKEFLSMPSEEFLQKVGFYQDAFINVAGFIPLGLVLAIFFAGDPPKKNVWKDLFLPVLFGGLLSLFIETNQVFLVSRSSSITDLVLNILGSGIGVGVYFRLISNFKSEPGVET